MKTCIPRNISTVSRQNACLIGSSCSLPLSKRNFLVISEPSLQRNDTFTNSEICTTIYHGGESHDFKTITMADTIEKHCQFKTFFDISVNTGQICMRFEAYTPRRNPQHTHRMRLSDKDLVKKLLTNNRKIRLLVNNFLTRYLSENR